MFGRPTNLQDVHNNGVLLYALTPAHETLVNGLQFIKKPYDSSSKLKNFAVLLGVRVLKNFAVLPGPLPILTAGVSPPI